jgi:putative methionine-R-sulfoxide reductase with GAF domain
VKSYRSHPAIIADIEQAFALKPSLTNTNKPLQRAVEALHKGRHYLWTGLYLFVGEDMVCAAFTGAAPNPHRIAFRAGDPRLSQEMVLPNPASPDKGYKMRFAGSQSELVVPLKIAGRIIGALDIESDRTTAFSPQERIFIKEIGGALAAYLTGPGKYVFKKAKDEVALRAAAPGASFRAAAGEKKQG